jgi:hypothetical protein
VFLLLWAALTGVSACAPNVPIACEARILCAGAGYRFARNVLGVEKHNAKILMTLHHFDFFGHFGSIFYCFVAMVLLSTAITTGEDTIVKTQFANVAKIRHFVASTVVGKGKSAK